MQKYRINYKNDKTYVFIGKFFAINENGYIMFELINQGIMSFRLLEIKEIEPID